MTTDFRVERDSMGELKVPAAALWGAQTQRAVNNFPISGMPMPSAFVRALGSHQVGRGRREQEPAPPARADREGDSAGGARDRGRAAPRAVPDRRVPDGLGHELEHERERGDREARVEGAGQTRACERSRQHEPEQQRRDPVRDPCERGARRGERSAAGARAPAQDDREEGEVGRRHREDRPHAPDGRDARAARSRARRLGGADPEQYVQAQGRAAAAHRSRARRHRRRDGHQRAPEVRREVHGRAREADEGRVPLARQLLRGDELAGHGGGGVRAS